MKKTLCILGIVFGFLALIGVGGAVGLYMWAGRDLPGFNRLADYRPAPTTPGLARGGNVFGPFFREKPFFSPPPKILQPRHDRGYGRLC